MNMLMREATGFDPLGSPSCCSVSHVEVEPDITRIEISHEQPQIPHASANIPRAGMGVIHRGRTVLLIELHQTGDARLQRLPLLVQITFVVVAKAWRAIAADAHAAHGVEDRFRSR